jgi:hypothetical protein
MIDLATALKKQGLVPFALISVETGKLARGILDLPDAYCY